MCYLSNLKMYSLLFAFSLLSFGAQAVPLSYPTTKTQGMVGFAKLGNVTGGWSGSVVEINTLDELQQYIGDSTAQVLVINSNITASNKTVVTLGSNKSIIGSFNKPVLHNIYLYDNTSSGNIIIQNLIFKHDASINGDDDKQIHVDYSTKIWIDHCSFVGHAWSANDGSQDKQLQIGEKAEYATISNCYFGNHHYGAILGHTKDDIVSTIEFNLRITICNNFYENHYSRAPGLMRYGHYHVFNNYNRNYHFGFTVSTMGKIVSENNYFEKPDFNSSVLNDKGTGQFTDSGSVWPTKLIQISAQSDWSPKSYYSHTLLTASDAKNFALANAGAQSLKLTFIS